MKPEEQSEQEALIQKCDETLSNTCTAWIAMIQIGPDWYGQFRMGGNIEACASMAARVEMEFNLMTSVDEVGLDMNQLDDDDED